MSNTNNKSKKEMDINNPKIQEKIKKLMELFDFHGIDYSKFTKDPSKLLDKLTDKVAYPNDNNYFHTPGSYDINKWLLAVKSIHYLQKTAGRSFQQAIQQVSNGWKPTEIYDFLNWLRFYNEGANMKYKKISSSEPSEMSISKVAQVWYENTNQPGYFLHIKQDPKPQEEPDKQSVQEARYEVEDNEEKKRIIEQHRSKIMSRLDSAEKLLRSTDGQSFAGQEFEQLMEAIHTLKRKVQLVNKLSVATRLYEDMIFREANVLTRKGFSKAANILYKVAQTAGESANLVGGSGTQDAGSLPPKSPDDPSGAGQSGTMGSTPDIIPGVPSAQTTVNNDQNGQQPPLSAFEENKTVEEEQSPAIKEFIANMNVGNKTDIKEEEDQLEVFDNDDNSINGEEIVVEAQAIAPTNIPPATLEDIPTTSDPAPERRPPSFVPVEEPKLKKAPKNKETIIDDEPLEVSEDDIRHSADDFNLQVDDAFSNMSLSDIVAQLEDVVSIYRSRELPRKLSLIDIALSHSGLSSSMFPSLGEAIGRSIDSNQYILTRLEDILGQLNGAIKSVNIDVSKPKELSPQVQQVKDKIENDIRKDKQRKEDRKNKELNQPVAEVNKPAPQIGLEDLSTPAQTV